MAKIITPIATLITTIINSIKTEASIFNLLNNNNFQDKRSSNRLSLKEKEASIIRIIQ